MYEFSSPPSISNINTDSLSIKRTDETSKTDSTKILNDGRYVHGLFISSAFWNFSLGSEWPCENELTLSPLRSNNVLIISHGVNPLASLFLPRQIQSLSAFAAQRKPCILLALGAADIQIFLRDFYVFLDNL